VGEESKPEGEQMVVRRAPRLIPFVFLGGALGFIGSLIATSLFPVDPSVGFAALAGYFSLFGVTGGIGAGLVVWLVLDRRSKRSAREVLVGREKS
jgi:hypothetical protein